jgi:hypothetical protein
MAIGTVGQQVFLGSNPIQLLSNGAEVFLNPYDVEMAVNPVLSGRVLELNTTVASYPGTGNTWFDISGNGFNFKASGSATFTTAQGWDLNGTSQYLWLTSSFGFQFTGSVDNGITLFIDQFKDDATSEGALFCGWNDSGAQYKFLTEVNTNETIESAVNRTIGVAGGDSTGTIATQTREIIGMSVSGSTQYRYNNNVQLAGTVAGSGGTWSSHNPAFTIGARLNGVTPLNYYNGKIKAVVAYNRALSSTERTAVYNYLLSL